MNTTNAKTEWENKVALWDHCTECATCRPGKPVDTTDGGLQPVYDRCTVGRDLEKAVYGE